LIESHSPSIFLFSHDLYPKGHPASFGIRPTLPPTAVSIAHE
jgi:hypothetical protein